MRTRVLGEEHRHGSRVLPIFRRFIILVLCSALIWVTFSTLAVAAQKPSPPPDYGSGLPYYYRLGPNPPLRQGSRPPYPLPEEIKSSRPGEGVSSVPGSVSKESSSISMSPDENARHLNNLIAGSLTDFDSLGLDLRHALVKISGVAERTGLCRLEESYSPQASQLALNSILEPATFGFLALFFLTLASLLGKRKSGKRKKRRRERIEVISPFAPPQLAVQTAGNPGRKVWVSGYFRSDGTYVRGHFRKILPAASNRKEIYLVSE